MRHFIYIVILNCLLSLLACNHADQNKINAKSSSGKDTTINVNDILFTTPTIENTFPSFEGDVDTTGLAIIEDDWRQIEFITKSQKAAIESEIDSIDHIYKNSTHKGQEYMGFKDIHVRKLIPKPVTLPLNKVLSYLGAADSKITGLNIFNNTGKVKSGFSFNSSGVKYYGLKDEQDMVTTLCIYEAESDVLLIKSIEKIRKFLKTENLFLVHWTHTKVFDENTIQGLVTEFESR